MKIADVLIAWTPSWSKTGPHRLPDLSAGLVQVGTLHSDNEGRWSRRYLYTEGACYAEWRAGSREDRERMLAMTFIKMVVRDQLQPEQVHRAFLRIDEYRQRLISPDTPGATDNNDAPFTKETTTYA